MIQLTIASCLVGRREDGTLESYLDQFDYTPAQRKEIHDGLDLWVRRANSRSEKSRPAAAEEKVEAGPRPKRKYGTGK